MKQHANVAIFVPHAGCPHRCGFCNQDRISGVEGILGDDEIETIIREAAESLGERMRSAEIAFFGGSFTALPRGLMLRLLRAARPWLGVGGFAGIRVSTRPDAIGGEVLDTLAEYGVTSIELGAQSMDDGVLTACGRGHTAADTTAAARLIRDRGFSLGLQMMTGLPEADTASDRATAEALIALKPDTVRIYPTMVLKGTAFADRWRAGSYRPQTLEEAVECCSSLLERFAGSGIRVIRLGLHDGPGLAASVLAGPYHPAFRELCESRILLRRARMALKGVPPGEITLTVATGSASKMAGQKRENTRSMAELGYRVRILEDSTIPYLAVRVSV